ncbi:hypothetical protein P6B95_38580 [Streptomyces atratus]|uniref:SCO6880 family protein n=1 Tax=Streptomyces atratus TaxID=1893 RepID=UPI0030873276|nr:hypothetical protein P6B95_38580 [Streptomyces atratus]
MTQPITYSGWQSEKSGFMGRLSGPGFALVAVACALLLTPVNLSSWAAAAVCVPLALLLLLLAFGRVSGLSADEWILLAVRHQIAVARKQNIFFSGPFAPQSARTGHQPMDLPGTLARLRILEAPWPGSASWRHPTGWAGCSASRTTRWSVRTPPLPASPSPAWRWWTATSRRPGSPPGPR